ncbi:hypothetical protein As57867_020896, partial [Aphanomyces stellatus]
VGDAPERKPDAAVAAADKPPLTLADEIKMRMDRRKYALSGKQDQIEQERDRKLFVKPVTILKAEEVAPPPPQGAPNQPPPPPDVPKRPSVLPTVDMSDDGSHDGSDGNASNFGDENDLLTQIKTLKDNQKSTPAAKPKPAVAPPASAEPTNPVANGFESVHALVGSISRRWRADDKRIDYL